MFNFEKIYNDITLSDIFNHFGVEHSNENMLIRCPFPEHNDSTASFSYNLEQGLYHCFGCNKGGDKIKFVMQYKSMSFLEAMQYIAEAFNIDISNNSEVDLYKIADTVYDILNVPFTTPVPRNEVAYGEEVLQKFKVTQALKISNIFGRIDNKYLKMLGLPPEIYKIWGLLPLIDEKDRILGFTQCSFNHPKYKNPKNSVIFKKDAFIYGLHLAKNSKADHMIIVEGYFDVIRMHQYGYNNTVGLLGINLTDRMLEKLKRYTSKLIIFLDNDQAGVSGSVKAAIRALNAGFKVRLVQSNIPKIFRGKDADETTKKAVDVYLKQIVSLANYIINEITLKSKSADMSHLEEYIEAVSELYSISLKQHIFKQIATALDIPVKWIIYRSEQSKKDFNRVQQITTTDEFSDEDILAHLLLFKYTGFIREGLTNIEYIFNSSNAAAVYKSIQCLYAANKRVPTKEELVNYSGDAAFLDRIYESFKKLHMGDLNLRVRFQELGKFINRKRKAKEKELKNSIKKQIMSIAENDDEVAKLLALYANFSRKEYNENLDTNNYRRN